MTETKPVCLYCNISSDEAPLVTLKYQGKEYYVCATHLPILIHEPAKFAGKLPGAELMKGAHHD
jgi:hypothetical protein